LISDDKNKVLLYNLYNQLSMTTDPELRQELSDMILEAEKEAQNETTYYFLVTSGPPLPETAPVLFVYVTPTNDENGVYTAHSSSKESEDYWNEWLKEKYYTPSKFINRFGYKDVRVGKVRDENHLDELFKEARIQTRTVKGKSLDWVELSTKDFLSNAPTVEFKEGSYTKPKLRENIKNRIMAGSKGGKPGQWSARKAQLLALEYRKAGGGYKGKPRKTQRSLKKWTREKWTTSDGKPAIREGGTRRYLPASAWRRLTPAQRAATNRKKIKGSRAGNQFVGNTEAAERAGRNARNK